MDRSEVVRLAREAGFDVVVFDGVEEVMEGDRYYIQTYLVERFAVLVAAAEREACAKACHEEAKRAYQNDGLDDGYEAGKSVAAKNCAAIIRARSNNGN